MLIQQLPAVNGSLGSKPGGAGTQPVAMLTDHFTPGSYPAYVLADSICPISNAKWDAAGPALPQAPQHFYQHGRFAITKLYDSPAQDVGRYELAEMNLVSAFGLPGTEQLDIGAMLAQLNGWAKYVAAYTLKHIKVYHARRIEFESLARYRVTAMINCLTREIGVRYNPDRITDPDNFDDPEDAFIHGVLGPRRLGTCASLPIVLTSVGRRLGYPSNWCWRRSIVSAAGIRPKNASISSITRKG